MIKACNNIDAEILVIDNCSTDGSRQYFANRFSSVKFIWQQQNTGFAKANNTALQQAKGDKILFLNPDTILAEDCLEKCLECFETERNIGALGVRMIDGAGNFLPESKRGFPSAFASFCKMTGLTGLFPHSALLARYYLGHLANNSNHEVDVLSGAFMMVEKRVLDTVGSFDEDYFMYAEDIDLSYRIQKAGYKNFYFAGTSIIHFKGESTSKQTAAYLNHFYGTMQLFVKKNYPSFTAALYILLLKVITGVKKVFAAKHVSVASKPLPAQAFVISDVNTFSNKKRLIEKYFNKPENITAIKNIPPGSAVIFCEPAVSFLQMINSIEQFKNSYRFFIHAEATTSIAGSADKNEPGFAFIL